MKTEFGEGVRPSEITELTKEIINLDAEQIDNLWYRCGWLDSERGSNKALPKQKIEKIRNNKSFALKMVGALILETQKSEVIENLSNIIS